MKINDLSQFRSVHEEKKTPLLDRIDKRENIQGLSFENFVFLSRTTMFTIIFPPTFPLPPYPHPPRPHPKKKYPNHPKPPSHSCQCGLREQGYKESQF